MKKRITMLGLVALSAIAMAMTGCCGSGSCPMKKGCPEKAVCKCGAPKGSPECKAACAGKAEMCKCGAPKGSPECKAACKK